MIEPCPQCRAARPDFLGGACPRCDHIDVSPEPWWDDDPMFTRAEWQRIALFGALAVALLAVLCSGLAGLT